MLIKFFTGLAIGLYFFTKMDILIWQRIFEANALWQLGIGAYHTGWTYGLFGFMALGFVLFFPHVRRMVMFPISLLVLAFCGLEDVLYYWLDGRSIPPTLAWLNNNPLILKPVTSLNLILSAAMWILIIVMLEILGERLDQKLSWLEHPLHRLPQNILERMSPVALFKRIPWSVAFARVSIWFERIRSFLFGRDRDTVTPK